MAAVQTFAEYLISHILPSDVKVTKPVDKKEFERILTQVARTHQDRYDQVVTDMKNLGDKLSTYDPVSIGLDEITAPNKKNRDAIIKKYMAGLPKIKDQDARSTYLGALQKDLAVNDLKDSKDDLTLMLNAAMGNKKTQAMKLRTSPGVVMGSGEKIVEEIFPKSYAEGVSPTHFFLNAAESRINLAKGAVKTAAPGELLKVMSNIACSAVITEHDCGTQQGILLDSSDKNVLDRYLARNEPKAGLKRGDLIDSDAQQKLMRAKVAKVLVRSPQTCSCKDGTLCQVCMGLRPATGKLYDIGENAGLITTGNIGEPLNQATISSKHATAMARVKKDLEGEEGFRQVIEMPKIYKWRKIYCEVVGKVENVMQAPQGGTYIIIRQTTPVPERYIEYGTKDKKYPGCRVYYIAPGMHVLKDIKRGLAVNPGDPLSDGVDNLKDVARLRNLGFTRTAAAQNMHAVYANSGFNLDRRHFELMARAMHPYVRIHSAPRSAPFVPGEVVTYQKLVEAVKSMPKQQRMLSQALGDVLGEGVLDLTAGTEIDANTKKYLEQNGVHTVTVVAGLEVAPETTIASRVVNKREDWLSTLNHRELKNALVSAASYGKSSNIHGYNPITSYAYGAEFGNGAGGKY